MDFITLGAALAIALTGAGVTIGEALVARKSINIMGKSPELANSLKSITILSIALVESAAIYGLVVALLIIFTPDLTSFQALAAGLSIGGVGLFTGLGEARVAVEALQAIHRNPSAESEIKSNMILFIALVESAAIYALVVSLLIIFS